ncbi:MAG: tRNA pseudouridine(38-40) synthase TruA, partial [Bowdeniella nasicola]|nr:tRNA pseudouridine(38-40) synthase TruA [Bowdeniella nasicola]
MNETVRLRLDIAYDGAPFSGWARQPGLPTVQGTLEEALALVTREDAHLTVAGRTDAGVHARGQVAHLDLSAQAYGRLPGRSARTPEQALAARLHGVLVRGSGQARSSAVVVTNVTRVPDSFDARFSAIWRRYRYRIADAGRFDPLTRASQWWVTETLDEAAMGEAAELLVGEWDFAALCKPREGASTIRCLHEARVWRSEDGVLVVELRADAFCHSMVRSIVGCLRDVGRGVRSPAWLGEVLASRDRSRASAVAPGHGLVLEEVGYPEVSEFDAQQRRARRLRTSAAGRAALEPRNGREPKAAGAVSQRGRGVPRPATQPRSWT